MGEEFYSASKGLDIEAHPTELAIVVKFGAKREQKIIYLKDLTSSVDSAVVSRFVLDKCSIIPAHRGGEVEQIIHYLQKRNQGVSDSAYSPIKTTTDISVIKASLEEVESYIEMLYEDSEKTKGTGYLLALSTHPENLQFMIENEVLMAALTRVFREDSKKNFELATNIAVIFLNISKYKEFQPMISHYKIGTLAMQLIENELKRYEIWKIEAKSAFEKTKKKWEFAIQRQDELICVLLQILMNLADDIKVEIKMIKRGILQILLKCLEHSTINLQTATVTFLWKLSVFVENKEFMKNGNVVEKLISMFPTSSSGLMNALFSLLFNLSFDQNLKNKMVSGGLVPFVPPAIETNQTALCLLYQLSTNDDAKAMITFTDALGTLTKMVSNDPGKMVVKAILINAALEKRNAQLICSSDGKGLDVLMDQGFSKSDVMLMKICRNIASHEGTTQDLFVKFLRKLMKFVIENDNPESKNFGFTVEALGTAAQIQTAEWANISLELDLISWIKTKLEEANSKTKMISKVPDDFLLQIVILVGSMSANPNSAVKILELVPLLSKLIDNRQEDDEIILQTVYSFYCLLTHPEINQELCNGETFVESLIRLMHDPNQQLRNMCDQALQFISESNDHWKKRISEERFRFHNTQWLEMVAGTTEDLSDEESFDDMNNVVLGAEELLEEEI
ncbi:hypothetical protein FO519_006935 [Halicephalobus sp. NKZ332]|nr:hypothetical protein FO519_006935 [Halicephalobus sp. NKZ332]